MKSYLSIMILTMLLTCSGCLEGLWQKKDSPPFVPPKHNTQEDIETAKNIVRDSAKSIEDSTSSIVHEVTVIQTETDEVADNIPDEARTETDRHLISIEKSSGIIAGDANEINTAVKKLTQSTYVLDTAGTKAAEDKKAVKILEKERDKALKERDEAIEAKNSALQKSLRWLVVASIVGAAALGVFGFMYKSKLSLTLSAVCIAIMSVAIFVQTYFIYILIFGGVLLAGLIGVLVWQIIVHQKAFKEVVDTVEITQDNLPTEVRNKIFGKEGEVGLMKAVQSPTTMELVKKEKQKMPQLWSYAKDYKKGNLNGGNA